MTTYTLTLMIDSAILATQSQDTFCIAKKVNGRFTTVFQDGSMQPRRPGQMALISNNGFQWTDRYRVFCTERYEYGMLVSSTTNNVDVSNGQMTSYNNSSLSQAATAPSDAFSNKSGFQSHEDSFIVRNVPRFLHAAVECLVGGNWAAIYVDPDQHIGTMDQQLTPMNEYMLFWDSRVGTNSMIDQSRIASPYTFSFLAGSTSQTIRFGYATPEKPASFNEQPRFYTM